MQLRPELQCQGLGAAATEIRQLEAGLAEADAERTEARTRYLRLGDKVEALLQAEATARSAAERDRGAARLAVQVRLQRCPAQAFVDFGRNCWEECCA